MKRFLFGTALAMVCALLLVVVVWLYLQGMWQATQPPTAPVSTTTNDVAASSSATTTTLSATTAPAGLPVSDIPMTDEQRALVERLGFDVDTMVLNQAVIDCAEDTLGSSRYQQIVAGDTPTFIETARLLPCLGQ